MTDEADEPQEPVEGLLGPGWTEGGETLTPETHPGLYEALKKLPASDKPFVLPDMRQRCWDYDLDGWCPLCKGDPERCPRTADG